MQESMQDAIAAEPEFHRCNSRKLKYKELKIRIAKLTFIPVKSFHKIIG